MFIGAASAILCALERLSEAQSPGRPIGLAVAFWGEGAEGLIRPDRQYRVICNLTSGGTNPKVVREILQRPNVEMRHLPNLHAKVSVFERSVIVSSANFSKSGLWLEGDPNGGWDEAAYEFSDRDKGFVDAEHWFESLFTRSLLISEEVLLEAETAWAAHLLPTSTVTAPSEVCGAAATGGKLVELTEDDLFEPFIKPRNRFRMAAPWLIQVFSKIEEVNKNSCYVPAYVANMIWTQSGNPIASNIAEHRILKRPSEVWDLAIAKSKKHGPRILALLRAVIDDEITPPAVRHWAEECARVMPNTSSQRAAFGSR